MKRLYLIVLGLWLLAACAFGQNGPTPPVYIDTDQIVDGAVDIIKTTGIADTSLSNVDPATGRAALELGTMATATATDYVATSSLAARLDTINASFSGDVGVTGHATLTTANATAITVNTINGAAPVTTAGSTTLKLLLGGVLMYNDGSTKWWKSSVFSGAIGLRGSSSTTDRGVCLGYNGGDGVETTTLFIRAGTIPEYADDAAAKAAGLTYPTMYRTSAGALMMVLP